MSLQASIAKQLPDQNCLTFSDVSLQPWPWCACQAHSVDGVLQWTCRLQSPLLPQKILPDIKGSWLHQSDPLPDWEEPEGISQTFYCWVYFTHVADKVSELTLTWIFMLSLAKLQNHLTLIIFCWLWRLPVIFVSKTCQWCTQYQKFLVAPYIIEKKYYIDLKKQQLCRSKPCLVEGIFCNMLSC